MKKFFIKLIAGKELAVKDRIFEELVSLIDDHGGFHNSKGDWGNGCDDEITKHFQTLHELTRRYQRTK